VPIHAYYYLASSFSMAALTIFSVPGGVFEALGS
jgi:hypothetical protein